MKVEPSCNTVVVSGALPKGKPCWGEIEIDGDPEITLMGQQFTLWAPEQLLQSFLTASRVIHPVYLSPPSASPDPGSLPILPKQLGGAQLLFPQTFSYSTP